MQRDCNVSRMPHICRSTKRLRFADLLENQGIFAYYFHTIQSNHAMQDRGDWTTLARAPHLNRVWQEKSKMMRVWTRGIVAGAIVLAQAALINAEPTKSTPPKGDHAKHMKAKQSALGFTVKDIDG